MQETLESFLIVLYLWIIMLIILLSLLFIINLRNIAKIGIFLSYDTAKLLIHALVSSKLDNCNSLLFGLPEHILQKLQYVQNASARVIAGLRKHDHIKLTLIELHWLLVDKRIEFKILLLIFKALNNCIDLYKRSYSTLCTYQTTPFF
jgi:hypothetical protein